MQDLTIAIPETPEMVLWISSYLLVKDRAGFAKLELGKNSNMNAFSDYCQGSIRCGM